MDSVVLDGRYIADHYPGIGRYVFNLVKALAKVAPEQRLTVLVGRTDLQTRFDLRALKSVSVRLLPIGSKPRSPRGRADARRACRRLSPALFHAPHVFSATRVPCASLVTINDLIPAHDRVALPSIGHRIIYRALLRRALTSATGIVTLSEAVRRELCADWGVSPERITVAPGAADPGIRPAPREQVADVRGRLGLPERYILYVGTSRPHKNLVRLVEAWAGLPKERRDGCRLVIAGPADPRHTEARRLARSGSDETILFTGRIEEDDLSSLYSGARLVVHPSLQEGFGLPIIEAMACGVPVACSRTSAFDEVSGGAALQFDPTSTTDIGRAIDRALNDESLREELVAGGLRRSGELSWEHTAALTLHAYREARLRHEAVRSGS